MITKRLTSDAALGAVGCSLAAVSATFGIYMTIHGPTSSLGTSKDFSVFAQLAPRPIGGARRPAVPRGGEELDMTATASIPAAGEGADSRTTVPGIFLRSAAGDRAEVTIGGLTRVVRVGDVLPGAGEILAIYGGPQPGLKTSAGLILAAAQP